MGQSLEGAGAQAPESGWRNGKAAWPPGYGTGSGRGPSPGSEGGGIWTPGSRALTLLRGPGSTPEGPGSVGLGLFPTPRLPSSLSSAPAPSTGWGTGKGERKPGRKSGEGASCEGTGPGGGDLGSPSSAPRLRPGARCSPWALPGSPGPAPGPPPHPDRRLVPRPLLFGVGGWGHQELRSACTSASDT